MPRDLVQPLGKGLGQSVGKDFGHDRAIVVVVGLAAADQFVGAQSAGHGKPAHVVLAAAGDRGDEVGIVVIMPSRLAQPLLPQFVQPGLLLAAGVVFIKDDVVARGGRRPEGIDAVGPQPAVLDDAVEELSGVVVEFSGLGAAFRMLQDSGNLPRISQAAKNWAQSIYGTSSSKG